MEKDWLVLFSNHLDVSNFWEPREVLNYHRLSKKRPGDHLCLLRYEYNWFHQLPRSTEQQYKEKSGLVFREQKFSAHFKYRSWNEQSERIRNENQTVADSPLGRLKTVPAAIWRTVEEQGRWGPWLLGAGLRTSLCVFLRLSSHRKKTKRKYTKVIEVIVSE